MILAFRLKNNTMGKKKQSNDNENKEEQELAEVPPGWKEPQFTKEDNPHGSIYLKIIIIIIIV